MNIDLALATFVKLQRAAAAVAEPLQARLAAAGLTESQFGVLEALLHRGPMQQHALAARILRTSGNVTLLVDRLEERGLVRRTREADDRRCVRVSLTETGEALIRGLFPDHARALADLFGVLTDDEQRTLGALCRRLGRTAAGLDPAPAIATATGTATATQHAPHPFATQATSTDAR